MADPGHRYLMHDRDTVFSAEVDEALNGFGLKVLRTPARSPMANAHCERVIGTIRRECLDYLIPLDARHLRRVLSEFATHYNRGVRILRWALGCRNPRRIGQFRRVVTDIECQPGIAWQRPQCSAASTTNIASRRMLLHEWFPSTGIRRLTSRCPSFSCTDCSTRQYRRG